MKNLLIFIVAIFAITGTGFTQDEAPAFNRSLSFYLDSFTGHLTEASGGKVGGRTRILTGNEFEFGMTYSQNFATVPWLSMWVKALIVTGTAPGFNKNTGDFMGNLGGAFVQPYGQPRAQVGVNLGGYAIFAMDTRGLLAQENYYTIRLGNAGAFTFQSILELWMVPQVNEMFTTDAYGNSTGIGAGLTVTVVDLFEMRLNYEIGFAPGWTYRTKLGFRFGGNESAEAFGQSFAMRWENQVVWSVTPSFYTWIQLRYHIANMANATIKTDNQLFLQAGLGYAFDFSKN